MSAATEGEPAPAPRPAAVLFDMDGTLVDTEPYWIEAEFDLVEAHGGAWSRAHALNLVGNDLLVSGRYIREHGGIDLEPTQIVEGLLDRVVARVEERVPWRPGAVELLADLRAHGVRCGLVTMSYQRFAAPVLDGLPSGTFEVVVTGETVARGKPHPEPYEKAAALLGLHPRETVAIEDSDTGARSAEQAGCRVVVVPNHVPVPAGRGRLLVESLGGLSARCLVSLLTP